MQRGIFSLLVSALVGCSTTMSVTGPESGHGERPTLASEEARGLVAVEPPTEGGQGRFLLSGATVMTAAGQVIEGDGYVLVDAGRIAAVGAGRPEGLEGVTIIDATGLTLTPGLIDTHSHLGVYPAPEANAHDDGNEATGPVTAGVWAEHSFWPQDPGLELAMAGGITSLQILPGSANLVGGRGVTMHLVPTRGSRAMRFPGAPETVKMACGENPKRVYGERKQAPSTRMGNLRALREALMAAERYQAQWSAWEHDTAQSEGDGPPKADKLPPERDLDKETLAGVLRGDVLVHVHCYRADDMLSFLQVAEEFDFHIASFHHALEAYKIRDILAAAGTASSTWADWWGFKMEAYDGVPYNAALLTEAGAMAIIHSDSAVDIQRLNQETGKALAAGRQVGIQISDDEALRWITLNPATVLGIADEVGSIEVGKRADLVAWTGHPFSVYSRARWVFVDGALRYDLDRREAPWSDLMVGQEGIR